SPTCCPRFRARASSKSRRSPRSRRSALPRSARSRPVPCSTFPGAGRPTDGTAARAGRRRAPRTAAAVAGDCAHVRRVRVLYLPVSILCAPPCFVPLLAGCVLGEWAGWQRWTAIGIGFSGVLLIARPGMGGMHPAALLCLGGAICYSVYNISTRVLARTDSNETTLFYSNFVGTVAALPALPFVWTTPHEPVVIVLMVLIGAFGSLGHYLLIAAHRLASASVLAPFIY